MNINKTLIVSFLSIILATGCMDEKVKNTEQAAELIPVTLENFKVAESNVAFNNIAKNGGVNKFLHFPVKAFDLGNQTVVRMNQDTIYSAAVIDVSKGATITMPETNGRYQSVMVVQNDHYINDVFMGAGTYEIKSDTKSNFVLVAVRTQINMTDPADADKVLALQSAIRLNVNGENKFQPTNYNMTQLETIRGELAAEALKLGGLKDMQGARGSVDEHMHLLGTAAGWGLLPDANASYLAYAQEGGAGEGCYQATYQIPPFNEGGFFSITMYDADGWISSEKAILNKNNIAFNQDGSFDANFGDCGENAKNNLPTAKGWNFLMRVYEPNLEKLASYKLPKAVKLK